MKKLNQHLTQFDLTALGVAAIIGAGIFSTVGNAAAQGGPAVSLLFIFTAFACGLSALCYAQFASSYLMLVVHIATHVIFSDL
jgi:APA family basic amino acid/polyamine antiporter